NITPFRIATVIGALGVGGGTAYAVHHGASQNALKERDQQTALTSEPLTPAQRAALPAAAQRFLDKPVPSHESAERQTMSTIGLAATGVALVGIGMVAARAAHLPHNVARISPAPFYAMAALGAGAIAGAAVGAIQTRTN
ncbi:MAG: hypothetical protein JWM90_2329, partial [Thermoleophilia bacterium]|nr:hypothetical protein [Thermoleophilia bacterium]